MGGNMDTLLMALEKPDWGLAKGTRRAVRRQGLIRVLLNVGDIFAGDFVAPTGSDAERLNKPTRTIRARVGLEWIRSPTRANGALRVGTLFRMTSAPVAAHAGQGARC